MMRKTIAAGFACLSTLVAAMPAYADVSPTAGHGSAAVLFGYGFKDGVDLGLGVRAGYTLPMNVYLGGTFVYHFGNSQSVPPVDVSTKLYYFGVEGGYDIPVSSVVIRPYLGLGDATAKGSFSGYCLNGLACVPSTSASDSKFAAWPGATLLYPMGSAFIGADARFLIVSDFNAFSLFATGGLQF